ncbi:hypothetical protein [Nocardiopsis alba]|uniref:hypothetical protein n=1 Tax=Nocardiopsis alba TaxID=53437 RepID=UPI0035D6932B
MTRNLNFIDNLVPSVSAGDHTITVTQTPTGGNIPSGTTFSLTQEFTVTGLRLRVEVDEIHGVYPPPGMAGAFDRYLPHVTLERRIVPWERRISSDDKDGTIPWLGVLLFAEGELSDDPKALGGTETGIAKTLLDPRNDPEVSVPDFADQPLTAEEETATINTIRVPREVFARIAPTSAELAHLAHIRTPEDAGGSQEKRRSVEYAYLLANRLPDPLGGRYVAHLVSFEGHKELLDHPDRAKAHVRLVSLHHWSFVSAPVEAGAAYSELREQLTKEPGRSHLLASPAAEYGDATDAYTKRVRHLIETGHVALRHVRADRPNAYDFYRGPLTPYPADPVERTGMWWVTEEDGFGVRNVGHHTAWSLGRGLALADQEFSAALARAVDQAQKAAQNLAQIAGGRQARAEAVGSTGPAYSAAGPLDALLPPEGYSLSQAEEAWGPADGDTAPERRAGLEALDRLLAGEPPQFHTQALLDGLAVGYGGGPSSGPADGDAGADEEVRVDSVTMLRAGDLSSPASAPSATETVAAIAEDPRVMERFAAHVLGSPSLGYSDSQSGGGPASAVEEPVLPSFLDGLRLLSGVPFDHLVPDPAALPPESMRWFRVDQGWLDALVTGALWAGICGSHDRSVVEKLVKVYLDGSPKPPTPSSGVLIRSRLVTDFPQVGIVPSTGRVLRRAVLAPGVLLVLFDEVPSEVHLTEPDQGVHLGFGFQGGRERITLRALREVGRVKIGDQTSVQVTVPFRDGTRVLKLAGPDGLLKEIWDRLASHEDTDRTAPSPGEFGLQLVHAPERAILHTPTAPAAGPGHDEGAHT